MTHYCQPAAAPLRWFLMTQLLSQHSAVIVYSNCSIPILARVRAVPYWQTVLRDTKATPQNKYLFFFIGILRGELGYLAPLGSENISAPYFKQCFFRGGGGIPPPGCVKHHASQSQDRNNKYFILYIEFCINNNI